mgnify:CR=1 FL=1
MTQGGPGDASRFLSLYVYETGFLHFDMGYASALAWALFLIITVCTWIAWRVSKSRVHYEGGNA